MPSGLLGNLDRPRQLATANAVLGVRDTPHCDEPFIESERGIFKDRSDLSGELLAAFLKLALEHAAAGNDPDFGAAAFGANDYPVRPLDLDHVVMADLQSEILDGFHQAFGSVGVHARILTIRS